jgi:hypothetical protein
MLTVGTLAKGIESGLREECVEGRGGRVDGRRQTLDKTKK